MTILLRQELNLNNRSHLWPKSKERMIAIAGALAMGRSRPRRLAPIAIAIATQMFLKEKSCMMYQPVSIAIIVARVRDEGEQCRVALASSSGSECAR